MEDDLDSRFGVVGLRSGVHVRALETKFRPKSLVQLNDDSRDWIEELKLLAGLTHLRVMSESVRLLWAVRQDGSIWLAFEELVDPSRGAIGTVFVPDMQVPPGVDKLGHPALVEGKEARIAGELYLDEGHWQINNKSGRFGFLSDRSIFHLENVAAMFNQYGLEVGIDFIPPSGS